MHFLPSSGCSFPVAVPRRQPKWRPTSSCTVAGVRATVDDRFSVVEAVAIRGGKVLKTGAETAKS